MKNIRRLSIAVIAIVLLIFISFQMFMIRIELGNIGVRTLQYGLLGTKGVEPNDFKPGWHRNLPLLDSWNVFDATVQTTEFTDPKERQRARKVISLLQRADNYMGNLAVDSVPAAGPERITLKSRDGYTVQLDVTVKYRIAPERVHKMYQKFNTEAAYKGIVRDQVQGTLRNTFGTLRTEEFYDPEMRRQKTTVAETQLQKGLGQHHLELISILIRDISFDPAYERKILDKKLADQDVELNKSKATREEKRGETLKIEAATEAKVQVIHQEQEAEILRMKAGTDKTIAQIRADAALQVAQIKAEANLYAAQQNAKGDLLEKEADAKGEQLKATALSGSGGANFVARQAVENLKLGSMTVSTVDMNFLDIDNVLDGLGAAQ